MAGPPDARLPGPAVPGEADNIAKYHYMYYRVREAGVNRTSAHAAGPPSTARTASCAACADNAAAAFSSVLPSQPARRARSERAGKSDRRFSLLLGACECLAEQFKGMAHFHANTNLYAFKLVQNC